MVLEAIIFFFLSDFICWERVLVRLCGLELVERIEFVVCLPMKLSRRLVIIRQRLIVLRPRIFFKR